jgi:hypothetical protein
MVSPMKTPRQWALILAGVLGAALAAYLWIVP